MRQLVQTVLRSARAAAVAALAACVLLVGSGVRGEGYGPTDADYQPDRLIPGSEIIGWSVHGRPIECLTLGNGPDTILFLASIHGNEPAGTPIVLRLERYLRQRPDLLRGRRVVMVPVANPDGYAYGRRHNVRGIDLNRNFPASNFGARQFPPRELMTTAPLPLSEPEARALYELLYRVRPNRIVSIHQPIDLLDWDGPAASLAAHMADHTSMTLERLGSRPGSLGSFAGEDLQIPIVTVELPRDASRMSTAELWWRYGRAHVAAVTYPERVSLAQFLLPVPPVGMGPAVVRSPATAPAAARAIVQSIPLLGDVPVHSGGPLRREVPPQTAAQAAEAGGN